MGGTDEQIAMAAGFAGGLGLSGSGCGALAAAIWMNSLLRNQIKDKPDTGFKNPETDQIIQAFYEETDYIMECKEICGRTFESLDDHTAFVEKGGCSKLIQVLHEVSKT